MIPPLSSRRSVIQIVAAVPHSAGQSAGITGPERRAANLAPQWRALGYDITVLYPRRGALWDTFAASGVSVFDFDLMGKWDFSGLGRIRSHIKAVDAKLIHTQGGPAIDLAATLAGISLGVPTVITRPVMIEDVLDKPPIAKFMNLQVDRRVTLASASHVVAVSGNGFRRLRRYRSENSLTLIHNGIDAERFADAFRERRKRVNISRPQICMMGHLLPYKGWLDFVAVATRLVSLGHSPQFHVVGDGPQRSTIEAAVAQAGLTGSFTFHGTVQDVRPILAEVDVFLFTSHREGLSVAILEAMATGIPVVATDVAGTTEQIVHGVSGYVEPIGDINGLAQSVSQLLRNPSLREKMGLEARTRLNELFSESRMLSQYCRVYSNLIDKNIL